MRRVVLTGLAVFLCLSCNRGLAPTEAEAPSFLLSFPIPPTGGDPTGYWKPSEDDPLRVAFLDSSQVTSLVDSLVLESHLSGFFRIDPFGTYEIDAEMSITPTAYISMLPNPIILATVVDTLQGKGTYLNFEEDHAIVFLGLTSTYFDVDTLGYSVESGPQAKARRLRLVSLPNTFPYPGFDWIQFYFVFRLQEWGPGSAAELGKSGSRARQNAGRRIDL